MEALQANVNATCPSVFGGQTGALFASAVSALVAAHCSLADDLQWPKDAYSEIWGRSESVTVDFIVVGAGTAGSHLASKLVQDFPTHSTLLIEAGDDPGIDNEIPGFLFFTPDMPIDWGYKTSSSKEHCLGFNNESCIWTKGKSMGGSNSINAMLYTRGNPNDYNRWASNGNLDWDYDSIKQYFENIENLLQLRDDTEKHPWHENLTQAWSELKYNYSKNHNTEAYIGVGITKLSRKKGKRLNSAKVTLSNVKDNPNFKVIKNSLVQRILIDPASQIAIGVEITHKNGNNMNIKATKEVILSAGTIATPQILMLSGIGPKSHLTDKGIETLVDLPVGKNLQDHTMFAIFLEVDKKYSISLSTEQLTFFLLQYMLSRTGPFSTIGITDFMAFIDSTNNIGYPDVQIHHTHFNKNNKLIIQLYLQAVGYKEEIINFWLDKNKDHDLIGIYPTLLHPKSRGEVLLRDKNPNSKPIIKAEYFKEKEDVDTMYRAIKVVEKLTNTATLKSLGVQLKLDLKPCKRYILDSYQYWKCYIKHISTTVYHAVGTVKMGPINDKTTVVNSDLIVHGIKNLRVVDASIMPFITGGNTMAPTLMIADKAANIIKKHYAKNEKLYNEL